MPENIATNIDEGLAGECLVALQRTKRPNVWAKPVQQQTLFGFVAQAPQAPQAHTSHRHE